MGAELLSHAACVGSGQRSTMILPSGPVMNCPQHPQNEVRLAEQLSRAAAGVKSAAARWRDNTEHELFRQFNLRGEVDGDSDRQYRW